MTEVDFYVLSDKAPQAGVQFTCRLAEKIFKGGHQVYINTASEQQLKQLDDLLWSFRPGSFLPHAVYMSENAGATPILLGHATEPEGPSDVLVNLAEDIPVFFSRFSRVTELVSGDDVQRDAARAHFRFYKDRGYQVRSHQL
ncbi:MAG: DNA polymerase III subunit chi [Gammaproteobacteria bacterium]|jgi:DNA polymerase-3 subunit chi